MSLTSWRDPVAARAAVLERSGDSRPFAESRPISVNTVTLEPPGPTEVLLEIEAAGICHSDLSVVDGARPRPVPMVLGHEAAGRVRRIGRDVDPGLVGRRVVTTFLPRCGRCARCTRGDGSACDPGTAANTAGTLLEGSRRIHRDSQVLHHHLGVSGFATFAVVDVRSLVAVEDTTPPEVAALLGCAVLTGGGVLLNVVPPSPESHIAVVGLGGVGMAAVLVAKALGARRVVGIDAVPSKLAQALALGVDEAYTADGAVASDLRADIVIEAAGSPRALETAFTITRAGGTTVTVGLPRPGSVVQLDPLVLTAETRVLRGSYMGSSVPARDIPRFEELWRSGRLPVEKLVTSRIGLDDINAAMDRLADGEGIRQMIVFEGGAAE